MRVCLGLTAVYGPRVVFFPSQGCLGPRVYLNPKTPTVSGSLYYDFLAKALHIRETPYGPFLSLPLALKGDPIERVYIPKFVGLGRVSGFKSEGCTLRCQGNPDPETLDPGASFQNPPFFGVPYYDFLIEVLKKVGSLRSR